MSMKKCEKSSEEMDAVKQGEQTKRRKKKRSKMNSDQADSVAAKISKRSDDVTEEKDVVADGGKEPTSKAPKEPSKRQLKREKIELKLAEQRKAGKSEAMQKGLQYVSKWKHAKSEWKFEKLRQIWLMDHLLDDTLIPDPIFPTVIEYFEGCKGMARQQIVKKMMEVVKKIEDERERGETEEIDDTTEYRRAREILQALPTETR